MRSADELPYLTSEHAGTGGVLRSLPEDFLVDEEPAYLPSGTGDHVYVRIEKRGMNTRHAVLEIARVLNIADRDIGVAGMKDRHAVTRQWLSLPPPTTEDQARALAIPDLVVLEVSRHANKLRTGHVRANRFRLRIRHTEAGAVERARAIMDALAQPPGAPNWYGEQRFGRAGDNADKGRAILAGEWRTRDRKLERLMVSALQSELFNAWLVARMTDGLYREVIAGDVLHKVGGGMFTTTDPAIDSERLRAGEVVLTGPMFGVDMRQPPAESAAAEREAQILAAAGLTLAAFAPVKRIAEGTRRDATVHVREATVSAGEEPSTLEVGFALPAGAYATAVMREVMKTVAPRVDDTPDSA